MCFGLFNANGILSRIMFGMMSFFGLLMAELVSYQGYMTRVCDSGEGANGSLRSSDVAGDSPRHCEECEATVIRKRTH